MLSSKKKEFLSPTIAIAIYIDKEDLRKLKKEAKMIKRFAPVIVGILISFAFFSIPSGSEDTKIWKNQFEKRSQKNVHQDRQMGEKDRKSKEG